MQPSRQAENSFSYMEPVEKHPLTPFLPENARVLFLGSFPPQKKRWSMDFYYPNFQNDHWRIEGEVWFGDRNRFVDAEKRCFRKDEIVAFLLEKGIAFYDTAEAVVRHKNNASDAFLEVVEPTDIRALLEKIPSCKAIVTTGEKACTTVCNYFGISTIPKPRTSILIPGLENERGEQVLLYRLPSSSRAYPLPFNEKVEAYKQMFEEVFR